MMKIKNGIEALELSMNVMGNVSTIYPTLLWDENEAVLVDTGTPRQLPAIREAFEKAGVPFNKLSTVILTHQDFDHIGSLPELLKEFEGHIEVLAHKEDKPYIEGDKPFIKMNKEMMLKRIEALPTEQREQFLSMLNTPITSKVDTIIEDGQVLPYCGGITVIFTPGHTPGHISLYHHDSKTLITGDAMVADNGKLVGPNPHVTPDMDQAYESLKKFTSYDIETVICYHGGVCTDNVKEQLAGLAENK
jgi:glyoxylase-like metal-dependent hydrolase (beta-lactamase superfamily II)